tara:strand:- start:182 stop:451 length:270 start_codon:yes stop_codon:yes gene_type:complete
MARKKGGKSSGFVSNGERPNVSKDTRKAIRRNVSNLETMINKYNAFKKGKNVMLTIPNPNAKAEPAKPFIRVNAKEVWRNPNEVYMMKS